MAQVPLYFIVWKEGKHFVSQCMNADVSSFGDSRDEAIANLNEAVALYFEDEGRLVQSQTIIEDPEIVSVPLEDA